MLGAAQWEHGTDFFDRVVIDLHDGTIDNASRAGFIVAADFPLRLTRSLSMAVGGWYNRSTTRILRDPQHIFEGQIVPARVFTDRSAYASAYANVFYKWVGVQAGIVPARLTQTLRIEGVGETLLTRSPIDSTLFAVARADLTDTFPKLAVMFGLGIYRYAEREAGLLGEGLLFEGTRLPASIAPSGFGNISWVLTRHLAVDFSAWFTGANDTRLGDNQARATIGLGVTF